MLEFSKPIQIGEIKSAGDDWMVEGYVATFGNVDLGNDVILPDAFADSLKSGRKVRFLHSHDPRLVLGVPKELREDTKGLFGSFKISKTKLGEDTRQLLMDGAIDSFSIGYQTVDAEKMDGVRQLKTLSLIEASLVAVPMNPQAVVTGFKDYMTLADRAGYINEEIKQLLDDLRVLVNGIDRPITETKRQELTELLESCSGLDAVRTDLTSVLSAAPIKRVEARRLKYELAEARKRLAHVVQE
jgi:HK97 family phage prohead protease